MTISTFLEEQTKLQAIVLETHNDCADITDLEALTRRVLRKVQCSQTALPGSNGRIRKDDFIWMMHNMFRYGLQPKAMRLSPELDGEIEAVLKRLWALNLISLHNKGEICINVYDIDAVPLASSNITRTCVRAFFLQITAVSTKLSTSRTFILRSIT